MLNAAQGGPEISPQCYISIQTSKRSVFCILSVQGQIYIRGGHYSLRWKCGSISPETNGVLAPRKMDTKIL